MKAIRHKPSGKWVIYNPFTKGYDLTSRGIMALGIYSDNGVKAFCDATEEHHPDENELVEVRIIEDKPVTEEVIEKECPVGAPNNASEVIEKESWKEGFRAAIDYLGVTVTEEGL